MYTVNDFKEGERVVLNATGEEAKITGIAVASNVIYLRCLESGEPRGILDVNLIGKVM